MASLELNVAPEGTQSQWVGEASIKGKSQVVPRMRKDADRADCETRIVNNLSVWTTVYVYAPCVRED